MSTLPLTNCGVAWNPEGKFELAVIRPPELVVEEVELVVLLLVVDDVFVACPKAGGKASAPVRQAPTHTGKITRAANGCRSLSFRRMASP